MPYKFSILFVLLFSLITSAETEHSDSSRKVKIKNPAKAENFDSQLVEGQVYRPDLSVVTGDTEDNSFGLIRLRANFDDHTKNDNNELIK